ncbi:MAG: NAD(P)-dependent oxidoreductase [Proteobacteria bacterium]|nr:NAD(P)-dependent oxidoreductase [Pseudomonadota bacterium]
MQNTAEKFTVGFIGLGAMGYPIAGHLLHSDSPIQVWNRTSAVSARFQAEYANQGELQVASALPELATACRVIFTCVSADQDLFNIIDQLLPALVAGTVICDHSTTAPDTARQINKSLQAVQCHFVDAPVSGGVEGARRGTLVTMVGGEKAIIEQISPLLTCYTSKIARMGPVSTGQATKAVNQVMVAGIAEAVTEALALAEKMELPAGQLLEVLGGGAAGNWFMAHRGKTMLADEFEVGFKLSLLHKDLGICEELARNLDLDLHLVRQAREDYRRLMEAGEGDSDISALIHIKQGKID